MAAANYGSLSERAQDTASTPTSPIDWDSDEPVAVNLSASMRQKRRRERKSAETSIEIVQGGDTDAPDGAEECPLAEDAPLLPPGRNGDSVTVSEPMTNSFGEQVFGIGLVVLAGMTFTGSNVLQNFFVKDVNFFFLLAVRAIMQLVVTDLDLKCSGNNVFGGETNLKARFKIVLQGLFGGILLLCIFYSVTHIPLGNASAIFFLTPTMTFILAPFMLRERTGIFRIAVIVCMLAGVIMIDRPTIFYPSDVPYHNHSQPTNASTTTTPAPAIARKFRQFAFYRILWFRPWDIKNWCEKITLSKYSQY